MRNDFAVKLPQCIIDGVAVGDDVDVFELEEDGDFGKRSILA